MSSTLNVFFIDVNYALANLHSYANNSCEHLSIETFPNEYNNQNDVLFDDDLVDDDDKW